MLSKERLLSPEYYFIITFGVSWLFWLPATLVRGDVTGSPWGSLLYLGGIGPAVAGITLTYLAHGKEYQKEYWRRIFDFKRIGIKWYTVTLLSYPLLSYLIALLAGTPQSQIVSEEVLSLFSRPFELVSFIVFIFLFGPFPEELGWRGYALGRLQERTGAVKSSLLVGVSWSIWHIPLFFMKGTYQSSLGLMTPGF